MWPEDSEFKIQDSKRKVWKCNFKIDTTESRKSKYESTVALLWRFYFTQKSAIPFAGFFHENSLIVAWRFRIQDSRFKKKSMKLLFKQNITDPRKSKNVSTIALLSSFYFKNKLVLSSAKTSHKNSLIVACCTFGKLKIRTLPPNRFKNCCGILWKIP